MGRPGDGRTGKVPWRMVPEFLRPSSADPVEGMASATAPPTCAHCGCRCAWCTGRSTGVIVPSGGRATAAAVPGAELLEIPGMGRDLPRWAWPTLVDGIARTAARDSTPAV